jgi:DUF4097 and DUF4098 domain-containing protein YvlB
MRHRGFQALVIVGITAFSLASCIMVMDPGRDQTWQPSPEFRKSVDFKAGGTVTLEHTLGNVAIMGWDKDAVEIVATGKAAEAGSDRRVRLYSTGDLEPSIDVRLTDGVLRIRTRSLGGPWASGGLDYAIQLPNSVNLDAIKLEKGDLKISDIYGRSVVELATGNLTVENFSGPLKASLGSGQADVELLDVHGDDGIDITVREGDISVRLEPDTNARIEAEAPKGEITSEYDLGIKLPARALSSPMGGGAARIALKALRGNIKILKTK